MAMAGYVNARRTTAFMDEGRSCVVGYIPPLSYTHHVMLMAP
jgi:hypothetical protein